jgi:DNA helicase II / ATP-dependent DNA helicase PcrA
MTPTPEQSAILDAAASASDNLMLNALAGTGKSATLKMIDRASKTHPALYLVFNKRNQLDAIAGQKAGEFRDTTTIKTFNGLGHGIWAKAITHPIVLDKAKSRTLWRELVEGLSRGDANAAWREYQVVMDGMEKAKAYGYVPKDIKIAKGLITANELTSHMDERPNEYALELIDQLLRESIRRAYNGLIDFNDQIYMPALFGGTFPRFPRVMVDEYQDQSPVNHAMLERLVKGRLIGVGDPYQNIYGFRGAKSGGMATAVSHYGMTELPLSVSFRCPSEIVKAAQWRVPHFQWDREGGEVNELEKMRGWDFPDDSTIICRNNAPLLRIAFRLISTGRSVQVIGSELGPRLVAIMKKLGGNSDTRRQVIDAIEQWREERLVAGSKSASDLADCMRVFADHGHDLGQMISYAEHLFKQTGTIRLLTGHKSKGLEFDNVFWLDPMLCDQREQDRNLAYVITTRSQNRLSLIDSSSIVW